MLNCYMVRGSIGIGIEKASEGTESLNGAWEDLCGIWEGVCILQGYQWGLRVPQREIVQLSDKKPFLRRMGDLGDMVV